ncbi:MAG: fibronectin type III domain-containing protein [Deltaproteobacteria bacterium]|nr:fibronectin type III domain-containing protein [Deltaproteobacteria bacterium]
MGVFCIFFACSSRGTTTPSPVDSGVADAGPGADAGAVADSGASCCSGVTAAKTGGTTIDGGAIYSSTRLLVSWTAGTGSLARYRVTSLDSVTATSSIVLVDAGTSSTTLTGLKSGTAYTISVAGCVDFGCTAVTTADASASATTEEEYWQIQGSTTKDNFDGGLLIVADGNTKAYSIRYPTDAGAPASVAGKVRLYYDAIGTTRKGVNIALSTNIATADASSVNSFVTLGADAGLFLPSSNTTYIDTLPGILTSQSIPLPASMGAKMRLFFEAEGADVKTRILSLDSNDGYLGEDFNSGASMRCQDAGDYSGGGCVPTVVVGVTADDAGTGLVNARQFKIGYPVLSSWIWDGAAGAFMFITAEDACGTTTNGLAYATWSGTTWSTEKVDGGSCPRFLTAAGHGPVVVHLGGVRYKLYWEDSTSGNSNKPLRVAYADGTRTGAATTVEFDDWESSATARQVHFLWPSGNKLSASSESGLGDHVIYCPTGDVNMQVMYMNLGGVDDPTWNTAPAGLGMAVLINP